MQLPGGLIAEGRPRDFAFTVVTGHLERAIAEAADHAGPLPERVTSTLWAALAQLGGQAPSVEHVAGLAVGDRQFLMRQLAVHLGAAQTWMTAACAGCGADFDFFIDHGALPVKEAGESFPFAMAETSLGRVQLRIPTGEDQTAVASIDDPQQAMRTLIARCIVQTIAPDGSDDRFRHAGKYSDADLAVIEAAVENVAPEVTTVLQAACSECGRDNRVEIDPYFVLRHRGDDIAADVHILASTYHWSEAEILGLTRQRRRRYLELIDRARGMTT